MQRLRVLRRRPPRRPQRSPQHHRHFPRSTRHVVNFRRLVHQLIHRQRQKIPEHDVHNRPQTSHRRAHAHPGKPRLRNRCIQHALRPKLFHQSGQHLERRPCLRHVFSKNAHARIAPHLFRQCFAHRLRKCQFPNRRIRGLRRSTRTFMPETAIRELTFAQAVREALAEEMRRDPRVCIFGEDVAEAGTPFKVLSGLVEEFGSERVLDTPISEAGFTGMGVGAAMTGLRPVVDIMFGDFLTLTMDQLVNQAAKVHYMSGGKGEVPMVLRTTLGATRRSAAQHSQSLHAWLCHVPGLKVVMPSTPYDAKGLLKSSIRDENPVVFFEDKMMYKLKGPVPDENYTIPLGVADVKREGEDITLVATSSMVEVALGAAKLLEGVGISAEGIDPRTMWPLDEKTLVESAKKTSRAIVIDEGYGRYGVTGEIASVIAEGAFFNLEAPVKRMGAMHVPIPFSPPLEDVTVPTEQTEFESARKLCGKA